MHSKSHIAVDKKKNGQSSELNGGEIASANMSSLSLCLWALIDIQRSKSKVN